jgi:hypothetical protein
MTTSDGRAYQSRAKPAAPTDEASLFGGPGFDAQSQRGADNDDSTLGYYCRACDDYRLAAGERSSNLPENLQLPSDNYHRLLQWIQLWLYERDE